MAEPGDTMWLSVPEAARHLGISECTVRKRIAANTLKAERESGGHWRVEVGIAGAVPWPVSSGTVGGAGPDQAEPIEAAYQVAGTPPPVALVPLQTMVEELRGLADQLARLAERNEGLALEVGQLRGRVAGHATELAARDQTLWAKEETIAELRQQLAAIERHRDPIIAAKDELIAELRRRDAAAEVETGQSRANLAEREATIAELRRRAEAAEAEREEMRGLVTLAEVAIRELRAAQHHDAPGRMLAVRDADPQPEPDSPAPGFWARLRRRFRRR